MPYIDSKVATNTNNKLNLRKKKKSQVQGGQKSDRVDDIHIPANLSVANQPIASGKRPANLFTNNHVAQGSAAPASHRASELQVENLKRNAFKSSNRKLERLSEKKDQVYLSPGKMGG